MLMGLQMGQITVTAPGFYANPSAYGYVNLIAESQVGVSYAYSTASAEAQAGTARA
jgi:hypothetical protein